MQAVFRPINPKSHKLTVSAPMWGLAALLVFALALAGCGTSSEPAPTAAPTSAPQAQQPAVRSH